MNDISEKTNKLCVMVFAILLEDKKARNSDRYLSTKVYDWMGIDTTRSFEDIMLDSSLPSLESIGRARRKVQEKCPNLASDKAIERERKRKEQEWKAWAVNG